MQKDVTALDAEGANDEIDRLAHGNAAAPQQTVIGGRFHGQLEVE